MPLIKRGTPLPNTAEEANSAGIKSFSEAVKETVSRLNPVVPQDAKGRQISRQGLFQAALQSVGVVQHSSGSFEDYFG